MQARHPEHKVVASGRRAQPLIQAAIFMRRSPSSQPRETPLQHCHTCHPKIAMPGQKPARPAKSPAPSETPTMPANAQPDTAGDINPHLSPPSRTNSNAAKPTTMPLDVFAATYTPRWIRDVNLQQPYRVIPAIEIPGLDIMYSTYASTFAGSDFLPPPPAHTPLMPSLLPPPPSEPLSPLAYRYILRHHLETEFLASRAAQSAFTLYSTPIVTTPRWLPEHVGAYQYLIHVPGLRENAPFVRLGDVLHLRQLITALNGQPLFPNWTGTEVCATVAALARRNETVQFLSSVPLDTTACWNVAFPVRSAWEAALRGAVDAADVAMRSARDESSLLQKTSWLERMLFAKASDSVRQTALNPLPSKSTAFHDPALNHEQQRSVANIVSRNFGPLPFLITGPAGTGKTKVLVETALQLLFPRRPGDPLPDKPDPSIHILLCAPSDPAADSLAMRLRAHLPPTALLRLNSPTRDPAEVPAGLLGHCHMAESRFALPPFTKLMATSVVVLTCRDAQMLISARLSNRDLHTVSTSLAVAFNLPPPTAPHWTALLIDEAAQAIEPEALLPLTVLTPPVGAALPLLVLAGDPAQLNPHVHSTSPIIGTSLIERLLARPVFANHPLARSAGGAGVLRAHMLPLPRPAFADLRRNYRSHAAILAVPNALFYSDGLTAEAVARDGTVGAWEGWRGRGWPVVFVQNKGLEDRESEGGGWYNASEAGIVVGKVRWLVGAGVPAQDVCVIAQFGAQVGLIRAELRKAGLWSVNVGPMEAMQGLEARVVVLCTTRGRERFVKGDAERGVGVIHQVKRLNVALTRAKEGLVVVGSSEVLGTDEAWKAWLGFCARNGLWEGEGREKWMVVPDVLPALERGLLRAQMGGGRVRQ
ncbi:P-loop containing nucleoside triphosphate hydrolase protein [Trichodelitschia bisporula]|uniref:P-loop containing nucleoside triphosphate hydrolase protein n=1 Tax=Trichodelitschia bisporula TaxID=703511 RepID=A0A6G1HMW3_9PEZI|nr:P-loop containing nucleoside triphosphate hydrolase protein [Trichodelitschia bisporula]